MSETLKISIIVPIFNAEKYLKRCVESLLNQSFNKPFEIILIDDASTDDSINILKKFKSPLIKLISQNLNCGPASTRNTGLKHAKGKYIFFCDADDTISTDALSTLYDEAEENNSDLIISDKKIIDNHKNLREKEYIYDSNKTFKDFEITKEIQKRLFDPLYIEGFIGITGRLFKRSIIVENKIYFQKDLRFLEDEVFSWDILSFCKNIRYIRQQLYTFYVYPNVNTGSSEGIYRGYSISNFLLAKNHVIDCFKKRNMNISESEKLGDQALIFFVISALISFSRSIIWGKVDYKNGKIQLKELIKKIIEDLEINKAIKNYNCSKNENKWIPRAINWKMNKLLEFMCYRRAKEIILLRKNSI